MSEMRELKNVYQNEPGITRRWFTDDEYWDLIVWMRDDELFGFQLCYGPGGNEKALTWMKSGEFSHKTVNPARLKNNRDGSPVLYPDGFFDKERIRDKFIQDSACIEKELVDFIAEKIMNFTNL